MSERDQNKKSVATDAAPAANAKRDWYAARMLATIVQVLAGLFVVPLAVMAAAQAWGWPGAVVTGLLLIPLWRVSGDFLNPEEERRRSFRAFWIYYAMALAYTLFLPVVLLLTLLEMVRYAFALAAGFASFIAIACVLYWIAQTYFGYAGGVRLSEADARMIGYGALIALAMDIFAWTLFRFSSPSESSWFKRMASWYRRRLEALEKKAEE